MKKIIFLFFTLLLIVTGCKDSKIQQGEIEYEITYPYSDLSGIMDVMLPKKMTVKFKGDKMIASIEKGKIFRTDIVSSASSKKISTRLDFGSEKIEANLSEEDLKTLISNQPTYNVKATGKVDTIAGLEATYFTTTSSNEKIGEFKCAFSNNISIEDTEWFTSYMGAKGVPLIYIIERYGIVMHLRATKFKSREVEDKEFNAEEGFKTISYTKYENKVNELFQLIIEE